MSAVAGPDLSSFLSFTDEDAWELGVIMRNAARREGLPICIDISRATGTTLFHASLSGATVDNDGWAARKAAVVYRFEVSSAEFGEKYEQMSTHPLLARWVDLECYAPVGGACPIRVEGAGIVAVVAVSGLPGEGDHDFIQLSLAQFRGREHSGRTKITG